jgi:hypothetical protein
MKKYIIFLLSALSIVLIYKQGYSQANVAGGAPGHARVGGFYLGWNAAGAAGTLDIKNDFNNRIDFYTNTNFRMKIMGGPNTTGGFVGIGNFNTLIPISLYSRQEFFLPDEN